MHNQYNIPIARRKRLLNEKIPTNLIHTYKYKDSTKKKNTHCNCWQLGKKMKAIQLASIIKI